MDLLICQPRRVAELPGNPPSALELLPWVQQDPTLLQQWINYAVQQYPQGATIRIDEGSWAFDGPLDLPGRGRWSLRGRGPATRLVCRQVEGVPAINVGAFDHHTWQAGLSDFYLVSDVLAREGQPGQPNFSGVGIDLDWVQGCDLHGIRIEGFEYGITVDELSAKLRLTNVDSIGNRNANLLIRGGETKNSANWLTDNRYVLCELSGYPGQPGCRYGVRIEGRNVGDQFFEGCFTNHCDVGVSIAARPSGSVGYRTNIVLGRHRADWCRQWGVEARDFDNLRVEADYCGVTGIALIGCTSSSIRANQMIGDRSTTSWRDAIVVQGCRDVQVDGPRITDFARAVNVVGSTRTHVRNVHFSRPWTGSASIKGQGIRFSGAGSTSGSATGNTIVQRQSGELAATITQVDGAAGNVIGANTIAVDSMPPV